MNWKTNQSDPNDPNVQESRKQALLQARSSNLIDDREEYLAQQILGKRVLDVGVVAHTPEAYKGKTWLHRYIHEKAAYCLGCDVLGAELKHLKDLGFNVICHDITRSPLDEIFDVIILGELIEHVGRPGDLFAHCSKMLRPGGKVILTTPNPWFITYALKALFSRNPLVESVDHVAWYDPATLCELGERAGFRLEKFTGVRVTKTHSVKAKLLFGIFKTVGRIVLRREALAKTIIYEFTKVVDDA